MLLQCPPSHPNAAALVSPESQVADMLRVIGDRVEDDYIVVLNNAADELLRLQLLGRLTYDALQEAALQLLHHSSSGWTQVAVPSFAKANKFTYKSITQNHCLVIYHLTL